MFLLNPTKESSGEKKKHALLQVEARMQQMEADGLEIEEARLKDLKGVICAGLSLGSSVHVYIICGTWFVRVNRFVVYFQVKRHLKFKEKS